jgi:menaquinone-specific isochorismate synthase
LGVVSAPNPLPAREVVRSVPVRDVTDLLAHLPDPSSVAWVQGGDGLVGWGEAARFEAGRGADRFRLAEEGFRDFLERADVVDEVQVPGSGPVGFGSFTFDPASARHSVLVVPRVVLGRRDGRSWVTTVGSEPEWPARVSAADPEPTDVRYADGSLTAPDWASAVTTAVRRIAEGELDKVVLARDLLAVAAQPLDPRVLLRRLADRFPECYTFAVAGLVGATPELLVRREADLVTSVVLAGSTARGGTAEADSALGEALLHSGKDIEEHKIAVDSVLTVLGQRCLDLEVDPVPSLLRLANVQHLATTVRARLAGSESALEVAGALHPTAAVCGTPTSTAFRLIRELEGMDRARYAGPVGWVDGQGNGEFGLALRCAELDGRSARLFAGGGIVAGSDPEAELEEIRVKFDAMQHALEG